MTSGSVAQLALLTLLLAVSIRASKYSATVRIINNSSYTLLRNSSNTTFGSWERDPPYRIYPFSEATFKINPNNDFSGSGASIRYGVILGHNQEWYKIGGEQWFSFNFITSALEPAQVNYETPPGGIMPLKLYWGKNFVHDTWNSNAWIEEWHQDGVEDKVKPLNIQITLTQNIISVVDFYYLYEPYDDSIFAEDQTSFLRDIIYKHWENQDLYWNETVLAPTTPKEESEYNCIAWGLGTSGKWRKPPLDYETAISQSYFGEPRWVQVTNWTEADAALYCMANETNGTHCNKRYVHAAQKIPNWLNSSKPMWSSKFGGGPLVTHETPFTITNGTGNSYGIPVVFFKQVGRYSNGWDPTPIIETNESARTLLKDVYSRTDRRVKAKFEELYKQWIREHPNRGHSDLENYANGKAWNRLLEFCLNEPAAEPLLLHEGLKGSIMVSVLLDKISPLKDFIPDVQDSISLQINEWEARTLKEEQEKPWKLNDKLLFTKLKYCQSEASRKDFDALLYAWRRTNGTEGAEWSRLSHWIRTHDARALILDHAANKDETLLERLRGMEELRNHRLYAGILSGEVAAVTESMRKSQELICARRQAAPRKSVIRRKVARKN